MLELTDDDADVILRYKMATLKAERNYDGPVAISLNYLWKTWGAYSDMIVTNALTEISFNQKYGY